MRLGYGQIAGRDRGETGFRRFLPVALPCVAHVRVVDAVLVRLLVQEVKHVLDGERQGAAAVGRAEDGLKEVVHELLQRALQEPTRHHGTIGGETFRCFS